MPKKEYVNSVTKGEIKYFEAIHEKITIYKDDDMLILLAICYIMRVICKENL